MGKLFGTDGVRGIANAELTCALAMAIGRSTAMVLTVDHRPVVAVGADTRTSSDMLTCAVIAGLCSVGADVIDLGTLPTPAVAYLTSLYQADAGIMLSASHNPAADNGIKLFSRDGNKLPDALEAQIEALVLAADPPWPTPIGAAVGRVTRLACPTDDYTAHIRACVPPSLDCLHIAIDCANGAACQTAEPIFTGLGAAVDLLFHHPNGENINKACGSTHLDALAAYVRDHHLDAGIAFDGDADRCLAVDETGSVVDGDAIMAICALDLKADGRLTEETVVGTVMTNLGFARFCAEQGIRFLAAPVGDRYVLETMLQTGAVLGGEPSGHIIFRDAATTGDGQLTAARLLSIMRRRGEPLSALAAAMPRFPQYTENLLLTPEEKARFSCDPALRDVIDTAKAALGDRGRIVVRPSGTEPCLRIMAEGEDAAEIVEIVQNLSTAIKKEYKR